MSKGFHIEGTPFPGKGKRRYKNILESNEDATD